MLALLLGDLVWIALSTRTISGIAGIALLLVASPWIARFFILYANILVCVVRGTPGIRIEGERLVYASPMVFQAGLDQVSSVSERNGLNIRSQLTGFVDIKLKNGRKCSVPVSLLREDSDDIVNRLHAAVTASRQDISGTADLTPPLSA